MKVLWTIPLLMIFSSAQSFSGESLGSLIEGQSLERANISEKSNSAEQRNFQDMDINLFLDESIEAMREMGLTEEQIQRMRSGDIVGNGGGALEADFIYAYGKLPKIISDCLDTHQCRIDDDQKDLLKKIRSIAAKNHNKPDKLIFLNKQTAPGFFQSDDDPGVRFAKTGFSEDAPIFVNLDMTYLGNSHMISTAMIFSILIHEIGHQAGIRSHHYLDGLGTIIRNYLNEEKIRTKIKVAESDFVTNVYNFNNRFVSSEINISFMGLRYELGDRVLNKSSCSGEDRRLMGYTIENIYHQRVINIENSYVVPMRAWIKLHCVDSNATFWPEEKDLSIDIKISKRFIPPGLRYLVDNITIEIQ